MSVKAMNTGYYNLYKFHIHKPFINRFTNI